MESTIRQMDTAVRPAAAPKTAGTSRMSQSTYNNSNDFQNMMYKKLRNQSGKADSSESSNNAPDELGKEDRPKETETAQEEPSDYVKNEKQPELQLDIHRFDLPLMYMMTSMGQGTDGNLTFSGKLPEVLGEAGKTNVQMTEIQPLVTEPGVINVTDGEAIRLETPINTEPEIPFTQDQEETDGIVKVTEKHQSAVQLEEPVKLQKPQDSNAAVNGSAKELNVKGDPQTEAKHSQSGFADQGGTGSQMQQAPADLSQTNRADENAVQKETFVQQIPSDNTNNMDSSKTLVQPIEVIKTVNNPQPTTPAHKIVSVPVRENNQAEMVQKVMDQILLKAAGKQNEFEIQLEPLNLGKLSIKVAYDHESTSISIVCANEKTLNLLSQGAKSMGLIMESHLGTPTTVYVEKGEDNYLDQHKDQGGQQQQQEQHPDQNQKSGKDESLDFMQQLRLGLIQGSVFM